MLYVIFNLLPINPPKVKAGINHAGQYQKIGLRSNRGNLPENAIRATNTPPTTSPNPDARANLFFGAITATEIPPTMPETIVGNNLMTDVLSGLGMDIINKYQVNNANPIPAIKLNIYLSFCIAIYLHTKLLSK